MSRRPSCLRPFLAGVALLALLSAPAAADKDDTAKEDPTKGFTTKGQVKIGSHSYKLEAGKLYLIRVEGEGFSPQVSLRPGHFTNSTMLDMGDTFQTYFIPRETRSHRLFILPSLGDDVEGGSLDYTVTCKPIPLAKKPVLQEKAELAATDPVYTGEDGFKSEGPHKAFKVKLKARRLYVIDMERSGREMDPYLMLEAPGGKVVARDDDGGTDSNARIIFQPRRDGEYKVIATAVNKATGGFTLTVRTTE
jgi:hypothetical protein